MLNTENRYPHLLEDDGLIWQEHHNKVIKLYSQFEYDVRVGDGRDPGPDFDPSMREMALALSCRRIDVVGHSPRGIDLFEITHSAGLKAIGQLISYPILYSLTYKPSLPIQPILICGEIQTDILPVLLRLGIVYFVYQLPNLSSKRRSLTDSARITG